jgi:ferredoxin
MDTSIFIAFSSPAGATRKVATAIYQTMRSAGFTTYFLDLAHREQHAAFFERLNSADANACLFIGSPVYRDVAVPPVMQFIGKLSPVRHTYAIPFVTWGGACSGIALWQMGRALAGKGYSLAGAAKIVGPHSMMWPVPSPEGAGHPDEADMKTVERLCTRFIEQLKADAVHPIDLVVLDYQAGTEARHMKERLDQPWLIIPKSVDEKKCTRCAICEEECPAAAITMDDLPRFNDNCFNCFNCVRLCPEEAIVPAVDMADIHRQIQDRVNRYNETREPLIFQNN